MMRFLSCIPVQGKPKASVLYDSPSMFCLLMIILSLFLSSASHADENSIFQLLSPETADLNQYQWRKRPIVIFTPSQGDSSYRQQIMMLEKAKAALADRDVIVLSDTSPSSQGKLRAQFQARSFQVVLIGKDGGVKLQRDMPISVETLLSTIDSMPMRKANLN